MLPILDFITDFEELFYFLSFLLEKKSITALTIFIDVNLTIVANFRNRNVLDHISQSIIERTCREGI